MTGDRNRLRGFYDQLKLIDRLPDRGRCRKFLSPEDAFCARDKCEMKKSIALNINGKKQKVKALPDTPLVWVLRDMLNLTGTKYGCGIGVCGACTIHLNGKAVRSCQITIAEAAGRSFTTIEGLSPKGDHPCQKAWLQEDVAQCGFCQPGIIMAAAAFLAETRDPSDEQIDSAMSDLVCRCGTYQRIRAAIKLAAGRPTNGE